MQDIFEHMFRQEPLDPTEAARRAVRRPLRRRFYAAATVGEGEGGFVVTLDGRPVRTPARRPLAAPAVAVAQAIAAEWNGQGELIDPASMPLTRLANSIIDGVAEAMGPVADEVAKYLGCDLVLYRATAPEGLVARQAAAWDPLLEWAHERLGVRLVPVGGIAFVAQEEAALAAARAAIPSDPGDRVTPWRLGAVHAATTLTGSAMIALALLHGRLSADEAWAAAHVDEDWNLDQWGSDDLALQRRAFREAEMKAASTILALLHK
jgi:chaperone required for assembly of F1-ATPase